MASWCWLATAGLLSPPLAALWCVLTWTCVAILARNGKVDGSCFLSLAPDRSDMCHGSLLVAKTTPHIYPLPDLSGLLWTRMGDGGSMNLKVCITKYHLSSISATLQTLDNEWQRNRKSRSPTRWQNPDLEPSVWSSNCCFAS